MPSEYYKKFMILQGIFMLMIITVIFGGLYIYKTNSVSDDNVSTYTDWREIPNKNNLIKKLTIKENYD